MAVRPDGTILAFITDNVSSQSKTLYFTLFFSMAAVGMLLGSSLVITGWVATVKTACMVSISVNVSTIALVAFLVPNKHKSAADPVSSLQTSVKGALALLTQNRVFLYLTGCILAATFGLLDGQCLVLGQYLQEVLNFSSKDMAIVSALSSIGLLCSPFVVYTLKKLLKLNHTSHQPLDLSTSQLILQVF